MEPNTFFQLIRKLPSLVEPNNIFSWSENFLILWNQIPLFQSSQLCGWLENFLLLWSPTPFFSWSENFLLFWNLTPFSADQKTLSYGTQHLYLKVHSYEAEQKTSFSCGTRHLFQLIRKLPFQYIQEIPTTVSHTGTVQCDTPCASTSTSVRSIYVLLRPF